MLHTSNGDFTVNNNLYRKRYTLYRSSTDHSELHLVCSVSNGRSYSRAEWAWTPHPLQQWKLIASAERSQPIIINVNGTNFVNRLVTSGKLFDGKDFNVRIVPVVFQDAGVYACFLESNLFPTIDLITVKVTAEPSDAVTEGDNVTLTCSVSHIIGSMRLVWSNGDGKRVGEKALTGEEKSPSLVIQKAERGRGNWRCVLFDQDLPRLFVPNYQDPSRNYTFIIRSVVIIGGLALLLVIVLAVVWCQRRHKPTEGRKLFLDLYNCVQNNPLTDSLTGLVFVGCGRFSAPPPSRPSFAALDCGADDEASFLSARPREIRGFQQQDCRQVPFCCCRSGEEQLGLPAKVSSSPGNAGEPRVSSEEVVTQQFSGGAAIISV
ncbi:uncharacterized protein LOC116969867 [Amblyraja radiata]|uniref:uncharacterized protein LOC116969867 n=1 Tax=Amblyraja radiata TaxID=386614 RepID=UPI001403E08A|nr:uncharacterized protein LOC116969867 [Amblyraja radiata]